MTTDNKSPTTETTNGTSKAPKNAKIASQIEYYFSDFNLRKDKFLKGKMSEDNGWVPIDVLLTFNRLKALTQDRQIVVEALEKNKIVGDDDALLVINDDATKVKRRIPVIELSEEEENELNERTIHFKGIPQDATLEEIRSFCSQYGKVESVEMRRRREDRVFKGCIMCTYATKEDANRALEGTEVSDPDIKFLRETKTQYFIRKEEWKKKIIEQKSKKNKKKSSTGQDDNEADENDIKEEDDADPVTTKGVILVLSDFDSKDVKYVVIKEFFKKFGDVKYVETFEDKRQCYVRFSKTEEIALVLKEAAATDDEKGDKTPSITISDKQYSLSVLDGVDEVAYWRTIKKAMLEAKINNAHNHRKGRGFRRGGGGYKGSHDRREKRAAGEHDISSPTKKVKTEDSSS